MKKASRGKAIFAGLVVLALTGAGISGAAESFKETNIPDSPVPLTEVAEEEGVLSFMLTSSEWDDARDGSIVVRIDGTTDDGGAFLEDYKATVNQKYDLEAAPGIYTIFLVSGIPAQGDNIFTCSPVMERFDGKKDRTIVLPIEIDTAKVAEAKKAAEEKAQKEAAEKAAQEKAAAEAAAAEAARIEAEQQAQAKAEAEAQAKSVQERTVYIASSGKGKKYHYDSTCSKMKGTISLTISEAESQGYTPCSKCT